MTTTTRRAGKTKASKVSSDTPGTSAKRKPRTTAYERITSAAEQRATSTSINARGSPNSKASDNSTDPSNDNGNNSSDESEEEPYETDREIVSVEDATPPPDRHGRQAQGNRKSTDSTESVDSGEANDDVEVMEKETPTVTYKKVNGSSRNRRRCNRLNPGMQSATTPDRNNRSTPTTTFITRISWKISLPSSAKPLDTIITITKDMLRELQAIDSKAYLIPWSRIDAVKGRVAQASEVPNTNVGLRVFLNRMYVPKPNLERTIYVNIQLAHDIDFNDIRERMQPWMTSGNHGFYYKMLQVEESVAVGWLLYSTREMDAGALADEIGEAIGTNVGLAWKIIPTGSKAGRNESKDKSMKNSRNKVQALQIEVAIQKKYLSTKRLLNLYSRKIKDSSEYPNGIRMRFVKFKKDAINPKERSKLDKLRERQKDFLQQISSTASYDVLQLDYSKDEGNIPTLRQMIMSLKSKDGNTPLFHCVDMDWRQDGFHFQYSAELEDEAETVIYTLIPILDHHFPSVMVDDYFTSEAIQRCADMKFCPIQKMVIDPDYDDNEEVHDSENLVGFEFSTNHSTTGGSEQAHLTRPSAPVNRHMPNDDDSVSTLGTKTRNQLQSPQESQASSSRPSFNSTPDSQSVWSSTSTVTLEQFNALEQRFDLLAKKVESDSRSNSSKLDALLAAVSTSSLSSRQSNPTGEGRSAGSPRGSPGQGL